MSKTDKPDLPDPSPWLTQSMRLTAFPSPSAKIGTPNWWADLVGHDPDERNSKPAKGELIEDGAFDGGKLRLKVSPLRIDWVFVRTDSNVDQDVVFANVGSFPEVSEKFLKLMLDWLSPTAVSLQRLAFGAVLLKPVENHSEGYTTLAKYLHDIRISLDSSDFFYQINRPRKSNVQHFADHNQNRLSKWSLFSMQESHFQIHGSTSMVLPGERRHACRLELDISTPADLKTEIPNEALGNVLREQLELGKEIALKGDIS